MDFLNYFLNESNTGKSLYGAVSKKKIFNLINICHVQCCYRQFGHETIALNDFEVDKLQNDLSDGPDLNFVTLIWFDIFENNSMSDFGLKNTKNTPANYLLELQLGALIAQAFFQS